MSDLFDLVSDRVSSKSRRTYSQRNVSSLQLELTKNRKMINVKSSKTILLNRTLSFKPLAMKSIPLTNVENTPMKKCLSEVSITNKTSLFEERIEETPAKDEDIENNIVSSEKMTRDIQRLAVRLRSSIPLYDIPLNNNQCAKPAPLHLSQVVNRVSRCNYVLRHYVTEAQKVSPDDNEIQLISKSVLSLQSHEKGRRRLFLDSPEQGTMTSICEKQSRQTSGVMKQLFTSPSSSFKRTTSSPNPYFTLKDKRRKLF